MRRAALLAAAVLGALAPAAGLPAAAGAAPTATLSASFTPERLGGRTTLGFGFQISAGPGQVPPALTEATLSYPNNLGLELSGLGLATCTEAALQAAGPGGCPADSVMGHGTALAEISLGGQVVDESAPLAILRAADREGHLAVLFDAVGTSPLAASVVFPGVLLPAPAPYEELSIGLPLIPSVPGAPDVALVRLRSTLGPSRIVYYEQAEGRTLAYRPPGILLPKTCPAGGFPFAAQFGFADGSHASAATVVPCPRATARPGRLGRVQVSPLAAVDGDQPAGDAGDGSHRRTSLISRSV
jgi:hypothetical protein